MKNREDLLDSLGRFSEPALLHPDFARRRPKHGYAMTQDIEAVSGQSLGPGTLYGAIARLEARKWIEPLAAEDRRRPYRLTGGRDSVCCAIAWRACEPSRASGGRGWRSA